MRNQHPRSADFQAEVLRRDVLHTQTDGRQVDRLRIPDRLTRRTDSRRHRWGGVQVVKLPERLKPEFRALGRIRKGQKVIRQLEMAQAVGRVKGLTLRDGSAEKAQLGRSNDIPVDVERV